MKKVFFFVALIFGMILSGRYVFADITGRGDIIVAVTTPPEMVYGGLSMRPERVKVCVENISSDMTRGLRRKYCKVESFTEEGQTLSGIFFRNVPAGAYLVWAEVRRGDRILRAYDRGEADEQEECEADGCATELVASPVRDRMDVEVGLGEGREWLIR